MQIIGILIISAVLMAYGFFTKFIFQGNPAFEKTGEALFLVGILTSFLTLVGFSAKLILGIQ